MADKRDYYEVLGVARDATADQIKSAYRKLAMKYHPDRNPGDKAAEEKFKEAAEAYDVLHDTEKRQRYDQFGHQAFEGGAGGGYGAGGMSMDDIFSMFGDLFGGRGGGGFGGFDDFFGGGRGRRNADPNAPRRGEDMTFRLDIDFDEAIFGSERTIDLTLPDQCPELPQGDEFFSAMKRHGIRALTLLPDDHMFIACRLSIGGIMDAALAMSCRESISQET